MDNIDLFFYIYNLNGQFWLLDQLMIFGTTSLIYLLFTLCLLLSLRGGASEKKAFLLILLALPVAVLLIKGIHLFFFEDRPFITFDFIPLVSVVNDASFPSRHATISAVIAFAFTYFRSKWTAFMLFLMVWIGLSRVYVGAHYPLDVIGGFAIGAISILITSQIRKLLKKGMLAV